VDSTLEAGDALRLPEGEARHVLKVLRGRTGDALEVVDAGRRLFLAELNERGEASVLEVLDASDEEDLDLSLYQAVPKGGRMDLVVEKATEVGATRIVPLVTERGVVRPRDGKVERWRRVAEAAARQSLRLRVPDVAEPLSFSEAVREVEGGVLLHNAPDLEPLEAVFSAPVSLFVGPEGGWSEDELRVAEEAGLALAQLGPYRLRSETAGMVAVARARAALERSVRKP
jgi:16S rRNA (uracil1498-N3)-methyltransferase